MNKNREFLPTLVLLIILSFSTGCQPTPSNSQLVGTPIGTPSHIDIFLGDGRDVPSLTAFETAEQIAREWNSNAYWAGIIPSKLMGNNTGRPPGSPGWFYKFKAPNTIDELYIQVVNNTFAGQVIAAPILLEPLPYEELPITPNNIVITEIDVVNLYIAREGVAGQRRLENGYIDFRLVYLSSTSNPIWSLFDDSLIGESLINVDAVTGELVVDPYLEFYR